MKREYLEKYSKSGSLLRTAENFGDTWVIHEYSGKNNLLKQYNNNDFNKIRDNYFKD